MDYLPFFILIVLVKEGVSIEFESKEFDKIDIIDLSRSTSWRGLSEYYGALERHWKICVNCGNPNLGTAMHLEHTSFTGSMHPSVIPSEYLLTRCKHQPINPAFVLTLDVALQWMVLKHDPREPTLLLFKFGWQEEEPKLRMRSCVCTIPGLSYELAEWIARNLTHVVGVATDTPTLESEQTREFSTRTVANMLGKNGIYMIENVNIRKKIPEQGCMTIAMPLKMLNTNYVPTRLTAFCPALRTHLHVVMALKKTAHPLQILKSRVYDVNLDELLN